MWNNNTRDPFQRVVEAIVTLVVAGFVINFFVAAVMPLLPLLLIGGALLLIIRFVWRGGRWDRW